MPFAAPDRPVLHLIAAVPGPISPVFEIRRVLANGSGNGLIVKLRRKTAELSGGILQ